MFAVIQTGGRQYRVQIGQTVEVELLPFAPDTEIELDHVLLVTTGTETLVGQPLVEGAAVKAVVARQGRGEKIIVFHFKSKKRYRRKTGHRQNYTYLTITDILMNGVSLAPAIEAAEVETVETVEATAEA